jgi:hypothetical protein
VKAHATNFCCGRALIFNQSGDRFPGREVLVFRLAIMPSVLSLANLDAGNSFDDLSQPVTSLQSRLAG